MNSSDYEALRENEERYRLVFENSPVSTWVEDFSAVKLYLDDLRRQGVTDLEPYLEEHPECARRCAELVKILDVNRAALEMHGARAKEQLVATLLVSLAPKSFDTFRKELVCLWRGDTELVEDAVVRTLDGETRYATLFFTVCPGYEDSLARVIVSLIDVTERKQAEDSVLRSDQRLRLHREQSPLGFLEWDENFRAIEWNAACERIFGYTREEAIGRHAKDLILPEAVHELVDGIYQSLMNQSGGQHSINENVTKDGRTIICEWHNTTLVDRDGKAIGVASVCSDITEQVHAEESIRKLSQAIEQSPVPIMITDTEGKIEFVNTEFTRITGYGPDEVLGENPRILKSGETMSEEYRQLWTTISSGGVWKGEFHNRKKNGELFWELATIAPVRNAENVITHYVAVKEDVTERKHLEERLHQTQKLEAVGQLAGGVAHDFNNMLSVIIGYCEMTLDRAAPDDPLRADLETIMTAAHRSAKVTRQLLGFARKQTIAPAVLDLNQTIEGTLRLLRRVIGENIEVVWRPAKPIWPVKMDSSQVDQILTNLCLNARDALVDGGEITVETGNAQLDASAPDVQNGASPGAYVMLAVTDDGPGMDRATLDRVFEPFFTTKKRGLGTGLGLATVYGIVKQNDGFIDAQSEPGRGSTFRVYIPRHVAAAELTPAEAPSPLAARGSEVVLVVEDDPMVLNLVTQMLEKSGYTVACARSPEEALRLVREQSADPQLLVTDVVMPGMTGRELEKQLRSLRPALKCLFMSGHTGDIIAHHGVLEKGVNFLHKPFTRQELTAKVRKALDSKSPAPAPARSAAAGSEDE